MVPFKMFISYKFGHYGRRGRGGGTKVVFIYIANKLVPIQTREYRKYDSLIAS